MVIYKDERFYVESSFNCGNLYSSIIHIETDKTQSMFCVYATDLTDSKCCNNVEMHRNTIFEAIERSREYIEAIDKYI